MRPEEHDIDFHAETAKILRKEHKAALSLRSLRFFDFAGSLRTLREKKETGLSAILIFICPRRTSFRSSGQVLTF